MTLLPSSTASREERPRGAGQAETRPVRRRLRPIPDARELLRPNAVLVLQDCGDYLEARWESGEVHIIYPVSAEECLDRMYWARLRFQRDPSGKVTGFTYHLVQDFPARKLD